MSRFYFIAALMLTVSPAYSATIHVPSDQPTIQAGIDAAVGGDTVLVADGTYTGDGNRDIDFGGKSVVLKSANGPAFTIIDCEGTFDDPHRGFFFHSNEDSTTVINGITIQSGFGADHKTIIHAGSVILCDLATPFRSIKHPLTALNRTSRLCLTNVGRAENANAK